jgi:hypothetical protein
MISGEEPALFHTLKTMKRRDARMICQIQDQLGRITDDPKEITQNFVPQMRNKHGPIEVKDNCVAEMVPAIHPTARTDYAAYLEQPITSKELFAALKSGGRNKAPGSDGINLSSMYHYGILYGRTCSKS